MIEKEKIKNIESTLKVHAKALGIPSGAAETFIKKSLTAAEKSLKNRKVITNSDLERAIFKELAKYHKDLAYVYENYDKII
ncbi:hypothetical protein J6S55_01725 [Candidatus Saccharibacteria bacterium]|nr:hypothetical protein [Candidatus Saccharibacteria bacterium]